MKHWISDISKVTIHIQQKKFYLTLCQHTTIVLENLADYYKKEQFLDFKIKKSTNKSLTKVWIQFRD